MLENFKNEIMVKYSTHFAALENQLSDIQQKGQQLVTAHDELGQTSKGKLNEINFSVKEYQIRIDELR